MTSQNNLLSINHHLKVFFGPNSLSSVNDVTLKDDDVIKLIYQNFDLIWIKRKAISIHYISNAILQ